MSETLSVIFNRVKCGSDALQIVCFPVIPPFPETWVFRLHVVSEFIFSLSHFYNDYQTLGYTQLKTM